MYRKTAAFLAAGLLASPALAEMHMDTSNLLRVSNLDDSEIYTLNREWTDDEWGLATYDAIETDWAQIGEVEDVILDNTGQMVGIVAEVGGFLDIGDKHVPSDDDYAILTRYSEEQLEAMEDVGDDWLDD